MKERVMKGIFAISAGFSALSALVIFVFLLHKGLPAIEEIGFLNFVTGKIWKPETEQFGIYPMILGSAYVTGGAIVLGVIPSVLTAVFIVWLCPEKFCKIVGFAIDVMASIPSVIYGLFALMVLVPAIREVTGESGKNIITASVTLAIMIMPTVISVSEAAIRTVPSQYYRGALALGATHEKSIFSIVLPAAKSGLTTGVVLGMGRAVGETMAVVMVAGNQPAVPRSLLSGVRTLTANIVLEMGYAAEGLHRDALIATGVILVVFVFVAQLSLSLFDKREKG